MVVTHTSYLGQVVLNDEAIARARRLGRNVGEAVNMPIVDVDYVGEEYWTCPLCYQNLLKVKGKQVECPICDVRGKIKIEGDEIKVVFSEEDLQTYRWGTQGLKRHGDILKVVNLVDEKAQAEIKEKAKKYESYKIITMPPL